MLKNWLLTWPASRMNSMHPGHSRMVGAYHFLQVFHTNKIHNYVGYIQFYIIYELLFHRGGLMLTGTRLFMNASIPTMGLSPSIKHWNTHICHVPREVQVCQELSLHSLTHFYQLFDRNIYFPTLNKAVPIESTRRMFLSIFRIDPKKLFFIA